MVHVAGKICASALILAAFAAAAHAASAKDVFESHGLLGAWAIDCSAAASADNPYVVFRPVESYVQRDTMVSATERADVSLIDVAALDKPDRISMRIVNNQQRVRMLAQFEAGRMRTIEIAPEGGEKVVADGRVVANGAEVPWINKCSP